MQGSSGSWDSASGSPSSSFPLPPAPKPSGGGSGGLGGGGEETSKCHSGPTPGLLGREQAFLHSSGVGVGGRLAGLDEESNSESFEVVKGWPVGPRIYGGPLCVASKWVIDWGLGEVGQEPPCGLQRQEGMNVIQTPWSHSQTAPNIARCAHGLRAASMQERTQHRAGRSWTHALLQVRTPVRDTPRWGLIGLAPMDLRPSFLPQGTSIAPLKVLPSQT